NDKPLLISYRGEFYTPITTAYAETDFGGEFETEADYTDPVQTCLIRTGGNFEPCLDEADGLGEAPILEGQEEGWILNPLVPFSYDTIDKTVEFLPSPPDSRHWLGTDGQGRDVVARIIYGFRLSVLFGFAVTIISAVIGIIAGAAQGFFGGWVDLFFQRLEEVWSSMNLLYVLLIVVSVLKPTLWVMFGIFVAFSWVSLIGVVRAEFLRARNFEYVRAARALGVGDWTIMFRHLLPNAMVATITFLPFMLTGSISLLAGLDFLDLGLGSDYPSLGELANQGKKYLQDTWLAISAFFTFAIMLSLLVFVFEGVRDAFDPRKTFR
ncbi:MAG: ABC transporter permease, partial [Pseudomonadota bacterium]